MRGRVATIKAPGDLRIEEREFTCPSGGYIAEVECIMPSLGTDLALYRGFVDPPHHGWNHSYPMPLNSGTTGYGRLLDADDIDGVRIGQRVAPRMIASIDAGPKDRLIPLPETIDPVHACFLHPGRVALDAVRRSGLVIGDDVVVMGLGPVGQLCARMARNGGARRVIGCDRSARKRALAEKHDIGPCFENIRDAADAVGKITGGKGAPVIFECSGSPECLEPAFAMGSFRARIILVGWYSRPVTVNLSGDFHFKQLQLVASQIRVPHPGNIEHVNYWNTDDNYAYLSHCFSSGTVRVDDLVTHAISLDELPEMFKALSASPEFRDSVCALIVHN